MPCRPETGVGAEGFWVRSHLHFLSDSFRGRLGPQLSVQPEEEVAAAQRDQELVERLQHQKQNPISLRISSNPTEKKYIYLIFTW